MLPNISEVVKKNWHILQMNLEFRNAFVNKPTIAFKRNKNVQKPHSWQLKKGLKNCQDKIREMAR